jgi:UDP-N-acetylmuramate--alanine ligase
MSLKSSQFHFIGIGGIGMCGLAELLHNIGAKVSGSDQQSNANTDRLSHLGIKVFKGHQALQIGDADVVVYSSAVKFDNPEFVAAKNKKIPLIPRAEALAEIMRLKRGIAIAGTHGKTTTTSLTASILLQAKKDPTIVVGGRLDVIKSTALLGQGEWLVAEADESDGSFQKLNPEISIITNIDNDHLDFYKTIENIKKAFFDFGNRVPFYGKLIVCGDDPNIREVFKNFNKKIYYYGFNPENDFVISPAKGKSVGNYEFFQHNQKLGDFQLGLSGRHNALNAAAAIITGMGCGLYFEECALGISRFQGVDRRMQFKGNFGSVKVYDDYGHHPTEIKATLLGVREKFPNSEIVVLFQPHRYSRTQSCWKEFTECFSEANQVYITEIYPAGESPLAGVTSEALVAEVKNTQCRHALRSEIKKVIQEKKFSNDTVIITLGAGDIWKVGEALISGT